MTPDECVKYYEETGTTHYYACFPFSDSTTDAKIAVDNVGNYWFEAETTFPLHPENLEWFPY